jgi:drug/metabolite transporter (DMT)-like permease
MAETEQTQVAGPWLRRPNRIAVFGMLVTTMFLWSLCYPLIRVGLQYAPPFHFATTRAVLAGAGLCLLAILLRRPMPRDPAVWLWLGLAGLGATTTGFYGMFFAGGLVPPGIATIMANTQPLIAAILAFVVLSERLRKVQWLGLGLGFIGILAIAFPSLGTGEEASSLAGYLYVLVAAVGVAVGNLAIKRVTHRVDVLLGMGAQLLIGSLPLLVLARSLEQTPSTLLTPNFIGILLFVSFAGTAVAFILWCLALRHIELSRANTFSFLTPLFAIIIGYVSYGEHFGWYDGVGGGLILLGLWCVSRSGDHTVTESMVFESADVSADASRG